MYPVQNDRRVFERMRVNLALRFLDMHRGEEENAQAVDISASGLGLTCDKPVALHEPLQIWLSVPDKGKPLYATGEAVWSIRTQQNQYRVGIDLDRADLMGISRVLRAARQEMP